MFIYKVDGLDGVFAGYYDINSFPEKKADVWFCEGNGYSLIGTYNYADHYIIIACCGEMRWNFPNGDRWTNSNDIPDEITTDKELMELMNDPDRVDVVNNCWLELFSEEDELMIIAGDIDEAIQLAHEQIVWLMLNEKE